MIDGPCFITPHAVRQFQARIAPLNFEQARAAIIMGLRQYSNVRPLSNGRGWRVRVRRPYPFRAVVVLNPGAALPSVITILRSEVQKNPRRSGVL